MSTKNSNISLPPKGIMDVWSTSFFINIKRSTYIKRLTAYHIMGDHKGSPLRNSIVGISQQLCITNYAL